MFNQPLIKKRKLYANFELLETPEINSIKDLIELGQSIRFYKNLNSIMIWKIAPYLEELDNMEGLEALKESVYYQVLYYIQGMHLRNEDNEYLHTLLLGPPGTGKTTVAKIMAKIYQNMGILSATGPFKIAYRDDFIAGYLGQTAIKTQKLLESCIGGVLFIDEFYSLSSGNNNKTDMFCKEALDTLTSFLSEHTHDFCCIGAGYEKDVKQLFHINSGLESRFQWKHIIEPCTAETLAKIFIKKVHGINWELDVTLNDITNLIEVNKKILFKYAGRDVINFISKCKMSHAKRVITLGPECKFILTLEDLKMGIEKMLTHTEKNIKTDDPPQGMYM